MKKIATMILSLSFIFSPMVAFGDHLAGHVGGTPGDTPGNIDKTLNNPISTDTFSEFVGVLISTIITVLFPFLVLAFIYVGFLFVMAQGNTTKLEEARAALTWTVVGAFIMMAAWGFSKVLEATVKGFE